MGLLQQKDNQYYVTKRSFTSDGTDKYRVSDAAESFHSHHLFLHDNSLPNPYMKVYIDGEYYAQQVKDDSTGLMVNRWYFLLDTTTSWWWHLQFDAAYLPTSGSVINIIIDNSLWQNPTSGVTEATTNNYQVTSLEDIIGNFMVAYTGEDKIISKVSKTDVQFHAMRALQELSFDTLKSCKSQEIEVPPSLTMVLPRDYVNYVKLSWVEQSGIKRILYPTSKTSNPFPIKQTNSTNQSPGEYDFNVDDGSTDTDTDTLISNLNSNAWGNYKSSVASENQDDYQDDTYWPSTGGRRGLDPQHAQMNGSYFIDCARGMIHFSSNISGKTVILDYISDSLGTDEEMVVHKFAEEAMYKSLMYAILSTRSNTPEYIVQRYKKERFAAVRKAKIRLSNIKIEELTQIMRGKSKFIKH